MPTTNTTEAGREQTRLNAKQRKAEAKRLKAEATQNAPKTMADAILDAREANTPEVVAQAQAMVAKTPRLTKTGLPALPTIKRARKPKPAKDCACGCGQQTRGGRFVPGHDSRLKGWLLRVERGLVKLEDIPAGERAAVIAHLAPVAPKTDAQ